jgi:small subunit ribosomal protein S11
MAEKRSKRRKKVKKKAPETGQAHISAGFNNTLITITDLSGKTICWASAGKAGFKGTRKSTPYAAAAAAERVGKEALDLGMRELAVFVKGPGSGRDAAIKSLKAAGLNIRSITDVTPIPHNGPRPRKRRRV